MSSAPIVVDPLSHTVGRRVTVHSGGREEILGTAYSDHDLVVFLEGAGTQDPDSILDDASGSSGEAATRTSGVLPEYMY